MDVPTGVRLAVEREEAVRICQDDPSHLKAIPSLLGIPGNLVDSRLVLEQARSNVCRLN